MIWSLDQEKSCGKNDRPLHVAPRPPREAMLLGLTVREAALRLLAAASPWSVHAAARVPLPSVAETDCGSSLAWGIGWPFAIVGTVFCWWDCRGHSACSHMAR